jgi:predicted hydrocarbon binding protein
VANAAQVAHSSGTRSSPAGTRVALAGLETLRALRHVIEQERDTAWSTVLKATGQACGRRLATDLEVQLAAIGKPALAALPLEACLGLFGHHLALNGWGTATLDLSHAAEHAFVIARVHDSFVLQAASDGTNAADVFMAGIFQAFFEHVTGQSIACEEIGWQSRGSGPETFVIATLDRLAPIQARIGQDSADEIVRQLLLPA